MAGNTLGYYNPYFYANEGLILLEKALGMASRVHRGFDEERKSFRRGEYVNISKPSTLSAQDAPATAEDLDTESVQVQLAYWREVKFKLTDKELAFASERIINDHRRRVRLRISVARCGAPPMRCQDFTPMSLCGN